jgi:hypothetical protein
VPQHERVDVLQLHNRSLLCLHIHTPFMSALRVPLLYGHDSVDSCYQYAAIMYSDNVHAHATHM